MTLSTGIASRINQTFQIKNQLVRYVQNYPFEPQKNNKRYVPALSLLDKIIPSRKTKKIEEKYEYEKDNPIMEKTNRANK